MPRIVFVHGSVGNGDSAWAGQVGLADRFDLVVLNRPGFPPNERVSRIDFEEHARWVTARLQPGDHLCGHSYGGVISLFAAAEHRDLKSLTVIEPPAFGLAQDEPLVASYTDRLREHWRSGPSEPRAFLVGFSSLVSGRQVDLPDPLPPELEQGAAALQVERGPWEANPPLAEIAAMLYPKLVVSGGWNPAFDAVCDVLERRLGAQRKVFPGAGHHVQAAPGFNEGLLEFLPA